MATIIRTHIFRQSILNATANMSRLSKGENNMNYKFENLRFEINNPEHSEAIQERLFDLGYSWGGLTEFAYTDSPYLYCYTDGNIYYSYSPSPNHPNKGSNLRYLESKLEKLKPTEETNMTQLTFPFQFKDIRDKVETAYICESLNSNKCNVTWLKESGGKGSVTYSIDNVVKEVKDGNWIILKSNMNDNTTQAPHSIQSLLATLQSDLAKANCYISLQHDSIWLYCSDTDKELKCRDAEHLKDALAAKMKFIEQFKGE
jgi:hypothetical protein